jgi:hypothetical protein
MILLDFIPVRFAGRDDADDLAAVSITLTDRRPTPAVKCSTQEHEALFIFPVLGIGDQTSVVIQDAVFASANETPCLRRLALFFFSSHSKRKALIRDNVTTL